MADLTIVQGTDSGYAWPILTADGEPFDLSGYSVKAQVRTRDGALLHEFSTTAGNALIAGNQVVITWASPATAVWRWKGGIYDLEITSPVGSVRKVDRGWITLEREVTR